MRENIIATRYAKGLAELAAEKGELSAVRDDLYALADLLDPDRGEISAPDLLDAMFSPTVPVEEKIKVTDLLCERLKIGETVSNFLNVLIRRNRVSVTGKIATAFEIFAAEFEAVKSATLESAYEVDKPQADAITKAISKIVGGEVRLNIKVNPDLIAGARVRIGDVLIDGSIDNHLQRMNEQFSRG